MRKNGKSEQSLSFAIEELFPDRSELSAITGWRLEEIGTIDAYSNSNATYSFPTAQQLVEAAEAFF